MERGEHLVVPGPAPQQDGVGVLAGSHRGVRQREPGERSAIAPEREELAVEVEELPVRPLLARRPVEA